MGNVHQQQKYEIENNIRYSLILFTVDSLTPQMKMMRTTVVINGPRNLKIIRQELNTSSKPSECLKSRLYISSLSRVSSDTLLLTSQPFPLVTVKCSSSLFFIRWFHSVPFASAGHSHRSFHLIIMEYFIPSLCMRQLNLHVGLM